jgi:hypothetical protein
LFLAFIHEVKPMTQAELNRQVADALGESIQTIADRGFVVHHSIPYEVEREPLVVDWDALEAERTVKIV